MQQFLQEGRKIQHKRLVKRLVCQSIILRNGFKENICKQPQCIHFTLSLSLYQQVISVLDQSDVKTCISSYCTYWYQICMQKGLFLLRNINILLSICLFAKVSVEEWMVSAGTSLTGLLICSCSFCLLLLIVTLCGKSRLKELIKVETDNAPNIFKWYYWRCHLRYSLISFWIKFVQL